MRYIFIFLVAANLLLLAWGGASSLGWVGQAEQGSFGASRAEPPGDNVKTVELLSTGSGDSVGAISDAEVNDPGLHAYCDLVGPLTSGRAAVELASLIRDQNVAVQMLSLDGDLQQDYWVLVPPLPSRQEALLQFQEFQSRNVDSFIVTQGEMENAISLGLFTQEALAQELRERLRKKGYPQIIVRVVPRDRQEIWLRVVSSAQEGGGAPAWQSVMVGRGEAIRRESICNETLLSAPVDLEFPAR